MTAVPFRARSVSELVDAAVQLLRRDYLTYVMIMAMAYVPYMVLLMFSGVLDPERAMNPTASSLSVIYISGLLWFTLIDGVITIAASEAYLGGRIDTGAAFRQSVARFGSLLIAAIVKWVSIIVGIILLIAPGVYMFARFFAIPATVVLEKLSPFAALGRSATLSKDLKWHVIKTLGLVWLIYLVLYLAIGLMAGGGAAMSGTISPTMLLVSQVVGAAFTILVYPVISIVQTLLYYDTRIRKEAFDIEIMTRELGAVPVSQTSA